MAVDGAYFGGYVKPSNYKESRRDRRLAINQNGKRRVVVAFRQRSRTRPPPTSSTRSAIRSRK